MTLCLVETFNLRITWIPGRGRGAYALFLKETMVSRESPPITDGINPNTTITYHIVCFRFQTNLE